MFAVQQHCKQTLHIPQSLQDHPKLLIDHEALSLHWRATWPGGTRKEGAVRGISTDRAGGAKDAQGVMGCR